MVLACPEAIQKRATRGRAAAVWAMTSTEFADAPRRLDARILLLTLGAFSIGTDAWVVAGILRAIAQDLSASIGATGQLVSAYAFTYAVSAPLLAAIPARLPWQRTVVIALLGIAVGDVFCAMAQSLPLLIAARVLAGASAALYTPTAFAAATALWPRERRGGALAKVALGTTAAIVIGGPAGTWIGHVFGWRLTFVASSSLAALAAVSLAAGHLPNAKITALPGLAARLAPMTHRPIILSLLATMAWTTGTFTVYTYIAVIFGVPLGFENIAGLLLAYGVGALAGSQSGGRLVDRFGTTGPILAVLSLTALNYSLMSLSGRTALGTAVALFIMGFCAWASWPAQQSRLLSLRPQHGRVMMSLFLSAIQIGSASGSALGGFLLAKLSAAAPPYAASVITIVGLAIFLLSERSGLRGPETQP
jgi:DHA1 family inner membrane transport protein